ncbi:MAG: hypothetical protein HJJLKODD_01852 [Phycisphaerae bacterium]|nr:hypothetical protein [Phycisphaerae bacterium]
MPELPLNIDRQGDVTILTFTSISLLETRVLDMVREEFNRVVHEMGRCRIIVDFKVVKFMSSYALSTLLQLNNDVQRAKGKLICCGMAKQLLESFKIAKLDKIFQFVPNLQAALQLFDSSAEG